jgi:hypothetical protein
MHDPALFQSIQGLFAQLRRAELMPGWRVQRILLKEINLQDFVPNPGGLG